MLKAYIPYYKRNLAVAFPVMLTQLGAALVGIADTVMVGHFSTTDLAAVSFANGIFFTVMVFSMGSLMGITPLVGQAYVQGDSHRVALFLRNGFVFACLLALLTCGILSTCVPYMDRMGQDAAVVIAARPYLITRIIGLFPFVLFCLMRQFLEGLGNTTAAMVITFTANLLNIFLNWLFIFGHWGFPAWGAFGAGLASLLSGALMPLLFFFVMKARPEWGKYLTVSDTPHRISLSCLKELTKVGFPIGVQTTMETILFTLAFIMVGWISKEALAAHHIANQVAEITFMAALGIGAATTIRVSHQYGLRDMEAVRMASRASMHLVLVINTVGAATMIGLRNYIPLLFTSDPEVIQIASRLLVFAGLFQYADGLQCVGAGMLRGITDVRWPMVGSVITYVVIALPLGYALMFPLSLGVNGLWMSFIVALTLAASLFHIRFWTRIRTLSR